MWIMDYGIHEVRIEITDADNDRLFDNLTTIEIDYFEISPPLMMEFILYELNELKEYINKNIFFIFDWMLINQISKAEVKVQEAISQYYSGNYTLSAITRIFRRLKNRIL